jgi:hypothetical protein
VARQERLWAEMDKAPNMKTGKDKKGDLHPRKKKTRETIARES